MQFAIGTQTHRKVTRTGIRQPNQEATQQQALVQGQTKTIEARAGLTVRATGGVLWLTQQGEVGDVLLRAGQVWTAPRLGRVVVQALGDDASLTVQFVG